MCAHRVYILRIRLHNKSKINNNQKLTVVYVADTWRKRVRDIWENLVSKWEQSMKLVN